MRRIRRLAIRNPGTTGCCRAIAAGVLAASGLLVACGSSDAEPAVSTAAAPAAELAGLDDGADIYAASCASCHGADLRGTDKGPSHLSIVYEPNHHGDASFRSAITNGTQQHHWGFGDMEPIVGLSEAQIDAVIAFVRAEQDRLGFEQ